MKWPTLPLPSNKKPGLVALLGALCLNPVTVSYLFTADGQLQAPSLRLSLWLLAAGMAVFSLALFWTRRPLPFPLRQVLLFTGCGYGFFCATVLADRLAGSFWLRPAQHLVFAPNTSARYQNPEFTVHTPGWQPAGLAPDLPQPAGGAYAVRHLAWASWNFVIWGFLLGLYLVLALLYRQARGAWLPAAPRALHRHAAYQPDLFSCLLCLDNFPGSQLKRRCLYHPSPFFGFARTGTGTFHA